MTRAKYRSPNHAPQAKSTYSASAPSLDGFWLGFHELTQSPREGKPMLVPAPRNGRENWNVDVNRCRKCIDQSTAGGLLLSELADHNEVAA